MKLTVRGETLTLLPERALLWNKTLLVADLHLGKTDAFRFRGLPLPSGANTSTLMRLTDLIGKSKANRLVILGDFWHAPQGVTDSVIQEITDWREQHASMKIDLILGNHDRRSPIPDSWNIEVYTESLHESPFVFDHYPEVDPRGYTLAGHLHPSTVLRGRGRQTLKLACFWFRDEFAVLPAFGSFTGTATIERTREDRVFAIAENEVIEIP